jgi:predicted ester cyclase
MNNNEDLVYRYLEVKFGSEKISMLDDVLAPGYKEHQPSVTRDINEVKEFAVKLKKAFPSQHFDIKDRIVSGDKIAVRYSWHAVHKGQFMNWLPTNKEISTHGIVIAKIDDSKIAELWEEWDFAGFLKQIETH